jgi:hypothetical protein
LKKIKNEFMKKFILCLSLLAVSTVSFSQQTKSSQLLTGEDYLRKSKKQKTAAWLMLGGGALLFTGGYTLMIYEGLEGDGVHSSAFTVYRTAFYLGGLSMLGSIPLFISAAENKGRAYGLSAGLKVEKAKTVNGGSFVQQSYPALAFRIQLGK